MLLSERLQYFTQEYVGHEYKYITVKEEVSRLQESLKYVLVVKKYEYKKYHSTYS